MSPYRRNRTLQEMARKTTRAPIGQALKILKIMIDAAITRGEQTISHDLADYVKDNADAPMHMAQLPKRRR